MLSHRAEQEPLGIILAQESAPSLSVWVQERIVTERFYSVVFKGRHYLTYFFKVGKFTGAKIPLLAHNLFLLQIIG